MRGTPDTAGSSTGPGRPGPQGLYDPRNEHDSCGVGFIVNYKNRKSHDIVARGLQILRNLTHRGAVGADPNSGDGAGILIQTPDAFLRREFDRLGLKLPAPGAYAVAMMFLPRPTATRAAAEKIVAQVLTEEGLDTLGWRDVPTVNARLGGAARDAEPVVRQLAIGRGRHANANTDPDAFERKLFVARKRMEHAVRALALEGGDQFYVPSMSSRTIVYKGMLLADQVGEYYPDLRDPAMASALAFVHQRFSTNTFPSWDLAHPFRMIAHNGEINTLRGNINWMAARRHAMASKYLGEDLDKLWPLIAEGQSDSACFDNALELLVAGGYSLAHAMMLLIPEAWAGNPLMDEKRREFYEYSASLIEPWDGPAAVAFTDGRRIGATLDRNGLRPARYIVTDDDTVIMASEMGVLDVPQEHIVKKWRLQPGKMLLIDLEEGRIIDDAEIKHAIATYRPYGEWLKKTQLRLEDLPGDAGKAGAPPERARKELLDLQQAFGYTQEDIKFILTPMVAGGEEPVGSMGNDAPLAVLSDRAKPFYNYFKQAFAQVTNPPIDPIREQLVMSLVSFIGPRPNLLGLDEGGTRKRLEVSQPVLATDDMRKIHDIARVTNGEFRSLTISICYPAADGAAGMAQALDVLRDAAKAAVVDGVNIIVLSDRDTRADRIPIPALLATSAVHHHLIRNGLRTQTGLVIETGSAREVHHFAMLAGYGAEAVHPWLAIETIGSFGSGFGESLPADVSRYEAGKRFIKAIDKGLLKVMSKMGISTYQSYCGAQIFEAVGLTGSFVEEFFTGTATLVEGAGLDQVAQDAVRLHRDAYGDAPLYRDALDVGGDYAWRVRGEAHMWTPETISKLQHATRANNYQTYKDYARAINEQSERLMTLRGLFEIRQAATPVPLDEVEPAKEIVKRFATGAMSFGSISREAHTTLAIAMNRIGGRSNTGEGGEEPERFKPLPNGDSMRSAIKQVAAGRFGVTTEYLVNADMHQIKMAQGAKPGEGGQLPGHKVSPTIAKVRYSVPGVGLISPPPHHDIYSIEDLAQLIFDLKNTNPAALISVKLVSEFGVGTVAAGVAKAHADHVTISGYDGGTGASPLSSTMHAGTTWELGLAETHQTLVLNGLRSRIAVQADGQMKTGRDVVIAALLGADEFGFATAPLVVEGCIMMRKCHLNTCPVGVATQDPELRKRFTGKPEHVVNYFFFVAEEVRELMSRLGVRKFNELIGHADRLDMRRGIAHYKARGLDFSRIFYMPAQATRLPQFCCEKQQHGIDKVLDRKLIEQAQAALEARTPVTIETRIRNSDRTAGAMLSGEVAKRYGHVGLAEDTIVVKFKGTAGQSFGAWLAHGVSFELEGEANDYVGKGLSGGRIVIYPPKTFPGKPEEHIIIGNTVLYGAISGECYFRGVAGERFAVRNSGATAVVEGVGDHGCEYMTGGTVVVLGQAGRNFAAGMSGGIAFVLDAAGDFTKRCNLAMVDLEPVPEEASAMKDSDFQGGELESHGRVNVDHLAGNDTQLLRSLIEKHLHYTGSEVARRILDRFDFYLPKFVKIMPTEYRRALNEIRAAAGAAQSPAVTSA